ncbi:MAG: ketosteroid isomerase [Sphingobacteriales bacterium]|nr:MAG: ketosteroid isomerase [Sphingobacteriales bacterium]
MINYHEIITHIYTEFNNRNILEVLSAMKPDVHWPNGWEGGYVIGHADVEAYWLRQWKEIDSKVYALSVSERSDGRIEVDVRQTGADLTGKLLFDQQVKHIYEFKDGLIASMEIESPGH